MDLCFRNLGTNGLKNPIFSVYCTLYSYLSTLTLPSAEHRLHGGLQEAHVCLELCLEEHALHTETVAEKKIFLRMFCTR